MFKRILVAVDGSSTSKRAFAEAMQIARESQSVINVVFVVDTFHAFPDVGVISVEELVASIREEGLVILQEATDQLKSASIPYESKLLETNEHQKRIAEAIVAESEHWPADLIILGTHGRRGFSRFVLGSVAESICRIASKPLLLIRGE